MGNLELSSAADLFGLTICVVPRNVLHPPKFVVGACPIALFYSGIHYDYMSAPYTVCGMVLFGMHSGR